MMVCLFSLWPSFSHQPLVSISGNEIPISSYLSLYNAPSKMRFTINLAAAAILVSLAIAAPVAHSGYDSVALDIFQRSPKDAATNALRPIPEEGDVYKRDPKEAATNALRPIPEKRDVYRRDPKEAATNALRPIPEERSTFVA